MTSMDQYIKKKEHFERQGHGQGAGFLISSGCHIPQKRAMGQGDEHSK